MFCNVDCDKQPGYGCVLTHSYYLRYNAGSHAATLSKGHKCAFSDCQTESLTVTSHGWFALTTSSTLLCMLHCLSHCFPALLHFLNMLGGRVIEEFV